MVYQYILKGKRPVVASNLTEWVEWFGTGDQTVKKTQVAATLVSTVFLGFDLSFGEALPLLFETEIFGGERNGDMWWYSTWEEAETGHDRVVAELLKEDR